MIPRPCTRERDPRGTSRRHPAACQVEKNRILSSHRECLWHRSALVGHLSGVPHSSSSKLSGRSLEGAWRAIWTEDKHDPSRSSVLPIDLRPHAPDQNVTRDVLQLEAEAVHRHSAQPKRERVPHPRSCWEGLEKWRPQPSSKDVCRYFWLRSVGSEWKALGGRAESYAGELHARHLIETFVVLPRRFQVVTSVSATASKSFGEKCRPWLAPSLGFYILT